jgi:ubiquinone/menaquinone biosynthesis C-methylase UbiE
MLKILSSILRPALVLLLAFLVIGFAGVAYQGGRTLQRLTVVEADRDQWQRPADIIRPLDLKDGSVVVDLGSGAGYFSLKLSDAVGAKGEVIAVDLRNLSLLFLRIRAFLQGKNNIRIVAGDPDDPHLPPESVDSVLVANTYHELTNPQSILRHISRSLRPGGRLVIVDPGPDQDGSAGVEHLVSPEKVEADLRKQGFEIANRDDFFIQPPHEHSWWLIAAIKS